MTLVEEVHAITPYINFEHIKGKENILADIFYDYESEVCTKQINLMYRKSMFDSETEMVCSIENSHMLIKTLKLMVLGTSLMQNM